MTTDMDRFHRTLTDGVCGDLEGYVDEITKSIVATIWNACDDERGRLLEENANLRTELTRLNAAANRGLDSLYAFITDSSDPGVEALGARYELETALVERLPHTPETDPTSAEQDRAAAQRMWDLAAYWSTVEGGQQVAGAITSVLEGTHRPLPDCTDWAWAKATEADEQPAGPHCPEHPGSPLVNDSCDACAWHDTKAGDDDA